MQGFMLICLALLLVFVSAAPFYLVEYQSDSRVPHQTHLETIVGGLTSDQYGMDSTRNMRKQLFSRKLW
ncbi:unnamed protein product [Caenorhabditis angaria]|uniref:Uncharacterized protein n=1 Tax=Caenorhabditis angaria TaxID=860376 RepID=A0A9P1IB14_9PELO|nr:unnamed protein product [Caenorhabditis angaria]